MARLVYTNKKQCVTKQKLQRYFLVERIICNDFEITLFDATMVIKLTPYF